MKDNIDRIPAIEWLFSKWAASLQASSRSDFLGSGKAKSMDADLIRTTGAVAFIVAMTVRHWAGL